MERLLRANAEIQPKLAISPPGNAYEQEADRVADQVMSMTELVGLGREQGTTSSRATDQRVQHQLTIGGAVAAGQELNPPGQSERSNEPLSSQEKDFFEPRFGHDFSRVRINADSRSAEMADALNAEAFTVGHSIYFGSGKLHPQNKDSNRLLAHELTHVTQQSRMGPALQPKLKITGTKDNLSRVTALLNGGLGSFYFVSVDASGTVSLTPNLAALRSSAKGPDSQQKAMADQLTTVINDPKDVIMTVSAGSKTLGGSFQTADFDIADLEVYGVGGLIHEIVEQHQKQAKGTKDFGTATTGAHGVATAAESEVTGLKRGADKFISVTQNADGTMDAVIETPHTSPDGKVKIKVSTIKNNNIVSVTWK